MGNSRLSAPPAGAGGRSPGDCPAAPHLDLVQLQHQRLIVGLRHGASLQSLGNRQRMRACPGTASPAGKPTSRPLPTAARRRSAAIPCPCLALRALNPAPGLCGGGRARAHALETRHSRLAAPPWAWLRLRWRSDGGGRWPGTAGGGGGWEARRLRAWAWRTASAARPL